MISEEEKRRGLLADRWERTNWFWVIGSCLIALVEFLRMLGTAQTSFGVLQSLWKHSYTTATVWRLFQAAAISFLLSKNAKRIKIIESFASDWEHAYQLGRVMVVFAKRVLILALIFWALEIVMLIGALQK